MFHFVLCPLHDLYNGLRPRSHLAGSACFPFPRWIGSFSTSSRSGGHVQRSVSGSQASGDSGDVSGLDVEHRTTYRTDNCGLFHRQGLAVDVLDKSHHGWSQLAVASVSAR